MDSSTNAASRAEALFRRTCHNLHSDTDRVFLILMLLQLVAGIIIALIVSPRTWIGATAHVHLHVYAAIILGSLVSSLPIFLAIKRPGAALTRHVIAIAQMLWSALLIHLSGGRIETHFHVFGSLAFLAFYRDWRVLITATVVVAGDHFVRGVLWPQSVFGVFIESPFRWVEHAAWVVFEDIFLIASCRRGIAEMKTIAQRQTALEVTNESIEQLVEKRTAQLKMVNDQLEEEIADRKSAQANVMRLGRLLEESLNEIYIFDGETLIFSEVNHGARENLGYTMAQLSTMTPIDLKPEFDREGFDRLLEPLRDGTSEMVSFESFHVRADGTTYPVEVRLQMFHDNGRETFVAMIIDSTQRQKAEAERDAAQRELVTASRESPRSSLGASSTLSTRLPRSSYWSGRRMMWVVRK